jgi:hypothetical protein
MRIDGSGNLGVGTTSPAVRLQAQGSIAANDSTTATRRLQLDISSTAGTINCANYGTGMMDLNVQGQNVIFNTGLIGIAERMRIDSSGRLLVNTTTANAQMCLNYAGNSIEGFRINDSASSSGSAAVRFQFGGTGVGGITLTGSTTSYNTSSDYRLKENVAPMTGALATVSALKPVTYQWKVDGSSGQGFIAHELQEVVPDCVTGEKDGVETVDDVDADGKVIGTKEVPKYQGIDTSFLVATLTAAIQELKATVDAQAARIAALENPPVESATNE